MDYFDVLRRGWQIAWRNKALWVLGLFAVGNSFAGSTSGSDSSSSSGTSSSVYSWLTSGMSSREVAALAVLVGVIALILVVLSIAARAGLIAEADHASDGEKVSLRRGWGVGFHYWWRTFGIQFVLALPLIVVALLIAGIALIAYVGAGGVTSAGGFELTTGAVLVPLLLLILFGLLIVIPLGVLISVMAELATRHGILRDRTLGKAIAASWADLRQKRGAFVMWLVLLLPEMVFGIVVFGVLLAVLVPTALAVNADATILAVVTAVILLLAAIGGGAVFTVFQSASWTVFFRAIEPDAPGLASPLPAEPPLVPAASQLPDA